ncbi:MAG: TolC family protein [Bdellovibrionaceae bacterium]|nr:TolC family protein [Pseudobdellovibrionaceae bacterium]NUM57362.1 TolC family protein [Pseudobdellovibrionaceae bacterium]
MMKFKKKSVKFLLIFIFLNSTLNATPLKSPVSETSVKEIIKNSSWKLKLQEAISKNPEFLYQGYELRQAELRAKQTSNYWLPYINLYGTKVSDQNQRSLAQTTLGLEANLNLFSFGKSYYLGQSSDAGFESQKLLFSTQSIAKENELLGMVFNDVYLRNKLSFYVEIENLKKKSLKVAEQRFERGNLPRQQVEKVQIDLNNFESQRTNVEKEIFDSQVILKKNSLEFFERIWPFVSFKDSNFKLINTETSIEVKQKEFEFLKNKFSYDSTFAGYWPSLDLSGHYYKISDHEDSNQWDVSLALTWKLWDNYETKVSNLESYKNLVFSELKWQQIRNIYPEKTKSSLEQLILSQRKLKKSTESLKKLNDLYLDSEKLFSQGRVTVNELFQDQQLLIETRINHENDLLEFHQNILSFCQSQALGVWNCLEQL